MIVIQDKKLCLMVHVETVELIRDSKVQMVSNVELMNAIREKFFWLMALAKYVQNIITHKEMERFVVQLSVKAGKSY